MRSRHSECWFHEIQEKLLSKKCIWTKIIHMSVNEFKLIKRVQSEGQQSEVFFYNVKLLIAFFFVRYSRFQATNCGVVL